jgi:hypothetical protein
MSQNAPVQWKHVYGVVFDPSVRERRRQAAEFSMRHNLSAIVTESCGTV